MYTYKRKAYFHETDQMGVIHHSNYPRWMEETRIGLMDYIGYSYKKAEENGVGSPIVELNVEYKKFVKFDDEVEVRIKVEKYTGISIEFSYEIYNLTSDVVSTIAKSKHCFIKDGKLVSTKRELPELDAAIRKYIEEQ